MKKSLLALVVSASILVLMGCGGSSASEPTATPVPTATAAPTATPTAVPTETPAALSEADGVLACLTEKLGESAAKVVQSGLIPLSDEQSAALGECVLSASTSVAAATVDPIVACLQETLDADLARTVASGAIPLTADQQTLLGDCVLSTSLGGSAETLSASVIACLQSALSEEDAQKVASGATDLTVEQEAALGGCLLGSALETTTSDTVSAGVMACLTEELGADVAQVVAPAALPLSASEQEILGNCVLMDALGITP